MPSAITMIALRTNPSSREATVPTAMTALDFSRPPTPRDRAASTSSAWVSGSTTGMSGSVPAMSGLPGSMSLNGLLRSLGSTSDHANGDADEEYGK